MDDEHREKHDRLLRILELEDLDALVLRRPGNLAWYSGGGRFHVVATPHVGVADLVVTRDGARLVTTVNEAPRLLAEETAGYAPQATVLPWATPRESALPSGDRVGSDGTLPGTRDVATHIEEARRRLTVAEVERYRSLGADAAAAVTDACLAAGPEDSEYRLAARVSYLLVERGIDPAVLLVAGESRLPRHRHPLPTAAEIGATAMVVVCARRYGLIASLTRFVSFGAAAAPDRAHAIAAVDAAFIRATVPGRTVGDAFRTGIAAYANYGFAADEWQQHHQGGPTGYEPRDYEARTDSSAVIEDRQAFAWNPSAPAMKSEDTILAGAGGPEILTVDPRWPVTLVDDLPRPSVLTR